jgi:hypothetical protein
MNKLSLICKRVDNQLKFLLFSKKGMFILKVSLRSSEDLRVTNS